MGIRNWQTVARDLKEWRWVVLEAKVHTGLQCLRRISNSLNLVMYVRLDLNCSGCDPVAKSVNLRIP